jgi:hypothetical protein
MSLGGALMYVFETFCQLRSPARFSRFHFQVLALKAEFADKEEVSALSLLSCLFFSGLFLNAVMSRHDLLRSPDLAQMLQIEVSSKHL